MVNHGHHCGCDAGYDEGKVADILIDIMSLLITTKVLFANGG